MPQAQFELRRKLLQLEALYDIGRALNTLRPEDDRLRLNPIRAEISLFVKSDLPVTVVDTGKIRPPSPAWRAVVASVMAGLLTESVYRRS